MAGGVKAIDFLFPRGIGSRSDAGRTSTAVPRSDPITLPDFIVAGAQRCGTTSLHSYLSQHPGICMTREKEAHYFCWDLLYDQGLEWYEGHFRHCPEGLVVGETTPDYMYLPGVPERMAKDVPDARLVFILRNPIDRAYSHYWHEVQLGWERLTFEQAVSSEPSRIPRSPEERYHFSYVDRGEYAKHLARFLEHFPEEQVHVMLFEDMRGELGAALSPLFGFLGVDIDFVPAREETRNVGGRPSLPVLQRLARRGNPLIKQLPERKLGTGMGHRVGMAFADLVTRINVRKRYPPMAVSVRDSLRRHFEGPNAALEELVGIDVSGWR